MEKEIFIKKTIKNLRGIPKYANSKQVEAIANQMWEEYRVDNKIKNDLTLVDEDIEILYKSKKKRGKKNDS